MPAATARAAPGAPQRAPPPRAPSAVSLTGFHAGSTKPGVIHSSGAWLHHRIHSATPASTLGTHTAPDATCSATPAVVSAGSKTILGAGTSPRPMAPTGPPPRAPTGPPPSSRTEEPLCSTALCRRANPDPLPPPASSFAGRFRSSPRPADCGRAVVTAPVRSEAAGSGPALPTAGPTHGQRR